MLFLPVLSLAHDKGAVGKVYRKAKVMKAPAFQPEDGEKNKQTRSWVTKKYVVNAG